MKRLIPNVENKFEREFFQEIKDKNNIVEIISEYVSLKRNGRSLLGLCPFHNEKTPSFNVNGEKQFFYCFGCGTGGDVFQFLMKIDNLDFITTAKRLAERAGISWPELSGSGKENKKYNEELYHINQLAAVFFSKALWETKQGESIQSYLEKRNITLETAKIFGLGYAPDSWHALTEVFRRKGVSLELAAKLGLIAFGEKGYYDRFRKRLIFPVCDVHGRVIGFGGRVLDDSHPKYLNTPETELFHKGKLLYGMHLAKDFLRKTKQGIMVEGYFDLIQAYQNGFPNTVASLGTAFTKEQGKILKRYTKEVVIAYDCDEAGQKATLRGADLLSELELTVKIITFPQKADPDSFLKEAGAAAFSKLLQEAQNLIDFKMNLLLKKYNNQTPESKNRVVQEVLPLLGTIFSNVVREAYIRQLAREIGVSELAIMTEFSMWQKKERQKKLVMDRNNNNSYNNIKTDKAGEVTKQKVPIESLSPLKQAVFNVEKELLQSALQEYDNFARIKKELKAEDFSFSLWRNLYNELLTKDNRLDLEEQIALGIISESEREAAASLMAEQAVKGTVNLPEELINRRKALRLKEEIEFLTQQITSGRDESGLELSAEILKKKLQLFTDLNRNLQKNYPQFTAGI